MIRITCYGTGTTALSYVDFIQESGQLTRITDKDGKSCYYTYGANNLLTSAQDVDGYKLTYAYNTMATGQPARIKTVAETDGTASGGTLSIEYAKNQTTFTDYNGNVQVMQFNNWGNTVLMGQGDGFTVPSRNPKANEQGGGFPAPNAPQIRLPTPTVTAPGATC